MTSTNVSRALQTLVDYSIFPFFVVSSLFATWHLLTLGLPNVIVTPIVVAPYLGAVFLLEKIRPEREFIKRDIPFFIEVAHFIFNFEVGYGLALLACYFLEMFLRTQFDPFWVTSWPLFFQFVLVVVLYEMISYWQHRLFHSRPRLWLFHALHHSGGHMDFLRAARFHFVDMSTVAFVAFLPLVIIGAPEDMITLLAVFVSILGLLHHANIRQRTFAWLDPIICTPAVHRRHHSIVPEESNANFGNSVMLFDILFSTYAKPDPVGPQVLGDQRDPLPNGFWAQIMQPFRLLRS